MTIPAIAEKPFALIDARIKECVDKLTRGTCGGDNTNDRLVAYLVQVALYKELGRFRTALEKAFTDDETEEDTEDGT